MPENKDFRSGQNQQNQNQGQGRSGSTSGGSNQRLEVDSLAKKLNTSTSEIERARKAVGDDPRKIEEYLRKGKM